LATVVGCSPKTVQQWIDLGWVKGSYEGKHRQDDAFRMTDQAIRRFWETHPEELPFHRWSREGLEWFLAVMVDSVQLQNPGGATKEKKGRPERKSSLWTPVVLQGKSDCT
jgi:hypothetical protein